MLRRRQSREDMFMGKTIFYWPQFVDTVHGLDDRLRRVEGSSAKTCAPRDKNMHLRYKKTSYAKQSNTFPS